MSKKIFGYADLMKIEKQMQLDQEQKKDQLQKKDLVKDAEKASNTDPFWTSNDVQKVQDPSLVDALDVQNNNTSDVQDTINLPQESLPNVATPTDTEKRGKRKMTVRYTLAIEQKIKEFCAKMHIPLQDFHELAVAFYMDAHEGNITNSLDVQPADTSDVRTSNTKDVWTSHDDLKIFKTHDDIIMLYKKMTRRRWTPTDDRLGSQLNNVDRRLVELGMIHTFLQARGKRINSFNYFLPEIQTVIEANFDLANLDDYLRRRREQLNRLLS